MQAVASANWLTTMLRHGSQLKAQREVGKGMLLCFACATGLYIQTLSSNTLGSDYARGAAATGSIFLALLGAYSWALLTDKPEKRQ